MVAVPVVGAGGAAWAACREVTVASVAEVRSVAATMVKGKAVAAALAKARAQWEAREAMAEAR